MSQIRGKLQGSIAGPGWVLRPGFYTGELDGAGLVWIEIVSKIRTSTVSQAKRVAVHASRFLYLESADSPPPVNQRAEINEQIKAANKAREARSAKA